jgi:glycosyltransferase involved in cell wall biosynthesis
MPVLGAFKVAIVIPAYNEEDTIEKVIKSVMPYGIAIVVNDGSSDNTSRIAKKSGAIVLSHTFNKGYDAALNTGLLKAQKENFNAVITFDGDGQHTADFLEIFIDELKNGTQLVLGIRPNNQRFSEWIFRIYTKFRFNWHDPLCGMKGYSVSLINGIDKISTYESIGTELALRSLKSNCSIKQIQIQDIKRIGQSRFGEGFFSNLKILRALMLGVIKIR